MRSGDRGSALRTTPRLVSRQRVAARLAASLWIAPFVPDSNEQMSENDCGQYYDRISNSRFIFDHPGRRNEPPVDSCRLPESPIAKLTIREKYRPSANILRTVCHRNADNVCAAEAVQPEQQNKRQEVGPEPSPAIGFHSFARLDCDSPATPRPRPYSLNIERRFQPQDPPLEFLGGSPVPMIRSASDFGACP